MAETPVSLRADDEESRGPNLWRSSAWSLGSLVKSITSKSEEVLHAYQRDLEEFGIGLKKETAAAAQVTAHAVKDLPISLEGTAAVAQESLEAVGQTLEEFGSSVWRGTAELIGQVKEAVQKVDEDVGENSETSSATPPGKYSRYEAQLNALQCDSSTYCDEPEDQEDYATWKTTFDFAERKDEIESIIEDSVFIQELHARIVPTSIDDQTFWSRYFYRLNKLQQAEDARADLVKRANATEEDLSWEVDEDTDTNQRPLEANSSPGSPREEGIVEDEARSDNSTSSDWLVVPEDKESLNSESAQSSSQQAVTKNEESYAAAAAEEGTTQATTEQKSEKPKSGESGEEDWGEWE